MRLKARMTASPISRMGTSMDDGWRKSSRATKCPEIIHGWTGECLRGRGRRSPHLSAGHEVPPRPADGEVYRYSRRDRCSEPTATGTSVETLWVPGPAHRPARRGDRGTHAARALPQRTRSARLWPHRREHPSQVAGRSRHRSFTLLSVSQIGSASAVVSRRSREC
jgi:hypothetical protein